MNPIVRHFLPSVMRGVYRLDDILTAEIGEVAYRQFLDTKIRLIPKRLIGDIGLRSDLGEVRLPVIRGVPHPHARQRAAAFFRLHPYFANALLDDRLSIENGPNGAQNFLEVEFVKKILAPALSEGGLQRARPQEQIGPYRVDFALRGTSKFALEVDGFGKFQNPAALDNFIKRQNYIAAEGWRVIRYTYSQIMRMTEATLRNLCSILAQDPELGRLLATAPNSSQAELFNDTTGDETETLFDKVNDFHRVQDLFADFCATHRPHDTNVVLRDSIHSGSHFVAAAIAALYDWLDAVAGVLDVDFDLPNVVVCGVCEQTSLQCALHTKVRVAAGRDDCDLVVEQAALLYGTPTVPAPLDADARRIQYRHGLSVDDIHSRLRYFTEHIFGYPGGTKPFQDRVLQRVFDGRDVLGISTTGSGKSFCFWLPALLRPGLTIVVAPLRSLMRDQIYSLRKNGIAAAEFINVDVPEATRRRIMEEARLGFIRLLYVAPERLRIKDFLEQLADLTQAIPINLLAIDEAHCISEWGHDFRPSYLKLPFVRDSLSRGEQPLQILALTATAGKEVEADMCGILKLRRGEDADSSDVIREAAADRVRFSYEIVSAENAAAKTRLFHEMLKEHIPTALGARRLTSLLRDSNQSAQKALGLVFCIYADPHGRHSTHEGTAHYLYQAMSILEKTEIFEPGRRAPKQYRLDAYSTGRVRVFASKQPTLCPHCNSYDYTSQEVRGSEDDDLGEDGTATIDDGTGLKSCRHCGRDFNGSESVSPRTWAKVIKQNQDDFKSTSYDILVATKGFGMGIDQGSVRFVVHTALSSGLESWYQEVGRAGRDNERAHIALLTEPPNSACMSALGRAAIRSPECKSYRSGCPHGKIGLCDYGKQHMFITKSYPGVVNDAFRALTMLDRICEALQLQGDEPVIVYSRHDRLSLDEIALYRLTVLGLVRDYAVSYTPRPNFIIEFALPDIPDTQEAVTRCKKNMQQHLREYLSHFHGKYVARSNITQQIEECLQKHGPITNFQDRLARLRILGTYTPLLDQSASEFVKMVYGYLLLLLEHTYDRVVKMRYDMLWNLLQVVATKECRRIAILDQFSAPPGAAYRCGLCDVCAPDLHFPDIRSAPLGISTDEELERRLQKIFANDPDSFDLAVLRELIHEFREYPLAKYRQARTVIQGSPNNLSALFVAREFSPSLELEGNARRLLRTANKLGISLGDVQDIYRTSPDFLKAEMLVSILNDAYSACNTIEGWEFLVQEASKPDHRQATPVAMMKECLEFFLIVEKVIPTEIISIKNKTLELEVAYG
jgi:ATP-dependent DNA helicase RecQ